MPIAIASTPLPTPAEEARETRAQTAQEATKGDPVARAQQAATAQTSRGGPADVGPATVVSISAKAQSLAAGDQDHDGDSK